MKQIVQSVRSGELRVIEVPRPQIDATQVLVRTTASIVSAGTERAARRLASTGLVGKARARPDLVRQVVRKARDEGVRSTVNAVRARLDEEMPLGYSAAGMVVAVGEAVEGIRPGARVATAGAGHAELQVVAGRLTVPIPEAVADTDAAFAAVASVALNGLRLADVGPGARVCVIGLGLLGQLTVRLARAAGYEVAGLDVRQWTVDRAEGTGALGLVERGQETTDAVLEWSRGRGVDAVLLTAATQSSDPARRSPALCRDRAAIVVVGDVGLDLERTPLYEKELQLRVARSYGPGRYERTYEDWGVDYPPGFVPWTEGRNLEAFLDLLADERVTVADLVTHRFPIADAGDAYSLIEKGAEPFLGVQLTYDDQIDETRAVDIGPRQPARGERIALIGAGNFARLTLVPALDEAGLTNRRLVVSASGHSAVHLAERAAFERAAADPDAAFSDPDVDIVVIATRHDSHASLTTRALEAGKHVFCEKPLALTQEELEAVAGAWRTNSGQLMVGFNRRYSDAVQRLVRLFAGRRPLTLTYRVSAGPIPSGHWYGDRRQGGRLIGEVCHFIDTCNAVVDAEVDLVSAVGSGRGEAVLDPDLTLMLRYTDGSLATIGYGSGGHPQTPKERLEVLGGGHTAVIDDFRALEVDGSKVRDLIAGKGHAAELTQFRSALRTSDPELAGTLAALHSMAVTLAAAQSLLTGDAVAPGQSPSGDAKGSSRG